MTVIEKYNEAREVEKEVIQGNIGAYDSFLEILEELNYELHEVIKQWTNAELEYKKELYQNTQALIATWMKKTPAEAEAKESMRDKEYNLKQIWNDVDFIKGYINLAKYTLKKSLLEYNKWLSEDKNLTN